MLIEFEKNLPVIGKNVFIAEDATLIGKVEIGEESGVWFKAVLRGDIGSIKIGRYTNIQDHVVVHTLSDILTEIGDHVTVGHRALIHGCKIGNNCLIGMGAIVMNFAEVGDNCIIGAGAVVTEETKIPAGSLVMGLPAKVKRSLTKEEIEGIRKSAVNYHAYSKRYGS